MVECGFPLHTPVFALFSHLSQVLAGFQEQATFIPTLVHQKNPCACARQRILQLSSCLIQILNPKCQFSLPEMANTKLKNKVRRL